MIKLINPNTILLLLIGPLIIVTSCKEPPNEASENPKRSISQPKSDSLRPVTKLTSEFKDYWYNGEAEITSYKLEQARYGEIRKGTAVLIFVTEDFLPKAQVKADNYSDNNIPILKLNATKNFNTGLYPYSIMQSTFYPVVNNQHALKISASVQEWCGQVYTQLNNRDKFEIQSHSYFQGEADEKFQLEKTWTENEIWTKLRLDPKSLPTGNIKMIPSLEYLRLKHENFKTYDATARLDKDTYTLTYSDLNRTLKINFNPNFPFDIMGWEERFLSGYGDTASVLTTKASKLETLKSDYWTKNNNSDLNLRKTLKLQ
ncbi:septum formation inhibitor Maf [Winogradskyella bathintestinalis]|uniref:Septum formation inhibitor Maf n=1 Tax=Winogradskyella bathintestinalis TaxID=3035208 RepID=A0ABT7ZWH4_9FLAO|nr:septum formation inhibitor Maf [Winogradskyella bathintestinalis]MDN3493348.1 septum formation inhibitor Maf [Winogradskyella bathintestinalis]